MNVHRDRDRLLQFLILNEEFLVNADHQSALITSLPFVHTARRTYRLNGPVKPLAFDLLVSTLTCYDDEDGIIEVVNQMGIPPFHVDIENVFFSIVLHFIVYIVVFSLCFFLFAACGW